MVIIMTFMKLIEETLKKANTPLTAEEIWEKANDYGFVNELKSNKGKTPEKTISARIYVDIKNGNNTFYQESKRPTKFFLKKLQSNVDTQVKVNTNSSQNKRTFRERDLHPLLSSLFIQIPILNVIQKLYIMKSQIRIIKVRINGYILILLVYIFLMKTTMQTLLILLILFVRIT